jgi:hypothetical protein
MDSTSRRSMRHQPSLLLGLPQDFRIEIAADVGATLERHLADLRSLHGTCLTTRRMCGHDHVCQGLSIEGTRDEISWVWNPTTYKAFLAMLTGLGHLRLASSPELKPSSSNTGDTMISGALPRVGTMRRHIYTPSIRRRDGWATRGVCLCARRPRVCSTTQLGAFGVNRCRLRHKCAAISRGVEKWWLRISLFCSEDCMLRYEMVMFAQSIGIGNQ